MVLLVKDANKDIEYEIITYIMDLLCHLTKWKLKPCNNLVKIICSKCSCALLVLYEKYKKLEMNHKSIHNDIFYCIAKCMEIFLQLMPFCIENNLFDYIMNETELMDIILKYGMETNLSNNIKITIIKIFGEIASYDETHTNSILTDKTLKFACYCLTTNHKELKKHTLWFISNILAGTSGQINKIIFYGKLLPLIIAGLNDVHKVKLQACWCLSNMISGANNHQIQHLLIINNIIPSIFKCITNDIEILNVIIDGIINLIHKVEIIYENNSDKWIQFLNKCEEHNIINILDNIQTCDNMNHDIIHKCMVLIDTYWNDECC